MKNQLIWFAAIAATVVVQPSVRAQDYPVPPTEEHKRLEANIGVWDADISIFAGGPDAEPMKSKGVEEVKSFGKLWIITHFKYDFMGAPAAGQGTIGYDPDQKQYVGNWHESGSPYRSDMRGVFDSKTGKIVFQMKSKTPQGEEQDNQVMMWNIDDQHRVFELHTKSPDSDEYIKSVQIKYTRKK